MPEQPWTPREMMAIRLAREIRDGEIGSPGGAASEVPMAAIRLAQLRHAPNASFISSVSGFVSNLTGKRLPPLSASTTDYHTIHSGAEALVDWSFVMASHRDFFFAGGLQVDRYGNVNLIGLGPYPGLKLRGPGTAGIGQAAVLAKRFYIYVGEHSPRTLVAQVDYISAPGRPRPDRLRDELGLPGSGPVFAVTPLGVLRFGPAGTLVLSSLFPGVDREHALASTPPAMHPPDRQEIGSEPGPSPEELFLLRNQVDPQGLLRQ